MRVLVTGAGGLIGSEAVRYFLKKYPVWGIDNDMRSTFFGKSGSVRHIIDNLSSLEGYTHFNSDITSQEQMEEIFKNVKPDVIIHCAAQPSHDKAADIPILDFNVNAFGTLNLLECTRKYCNSDVTFIHMSTNKVYGDGPNRLELIESDMRYDFKSTVFYQGIDEYFSIDNCLHSLFGASKLSADITAQEYGRYFGMNVGIFRGGCLTGPQHSGVELHGFLSYIVKCAVLNKQYTVFGYKGKQVRDQIHSNDVIKAFDKFIENPKKGEVYNMGGGRENSASVLEVIQLLKDDHDISLDYDISDSNRVGDHICYYTNLFKFKRHFPEWDVTKNLNEIIDEVVYSVRSSDK